MAELTTRGRHELPDSKFALPDERKYPIENREHAANAKARAAQQYAKGNLTAAQKAQIDRRANEMLYGSSKGTDGSRKVVQAMMIKKK